MNMKKTKYFATAIILWQFVCICILALQLHHERKDRLPEQHATLHAVQDTSAPSAEKITTVLPDSENANDSTASYSIEDRNEKNSEVLNQMLAKFHPIEEKSKSEIIQILADLYPLKDREESTETYTFDYDVWKELYTKPEEKEQLLLALLQGAQELMQIKKRSRETDPFANLPEKIQQAEKWLREAEAAGDWEEVEAERRNITRLKNIQEWNANEPQRITEAEGHLQENEYYLEKYDPSKWQSLMDILKKKELLSTDPSSDVELPSVSDPVDIPSEPSEPVADAPVSPPATNDPVKSLITAQAAFKPLRAVLNADYFDVVASRYLTPTELDEFFPTPEDRENLKRRTSKMQKAVVSKIRKVISDTKGATATEKRALARELVTQNFDKDFADAVLTELEKETE